MYGSKSSSLFLALPRELQEQVLNKLDSKALKNLRVTSRELEQLTRARLFNKNIKVTLLPHEKSYESFLALAESPFSLGSLVEEIEYDPNLEALMEYFERYLGRYMELFPHLAETTRGAFSNAKDGSFQINNESDARLQARLLKRAFAQLPHLEKISVCAPGFLGARFLGVARRDFFFEFFDKHFPASNFEKVVTLSEPSGENLRYLYERLASPNLHSKARRSAASPFLLALHTLPVPLQRLRIEGTRMRSLFPTGGDTVPEKASSQQSPFRGLKSLIIHSSASFTAEDGCVSGHFPGSNTHQLQCMLKNASSLEYLSLKLCDLDLEDDTLQGPELWDFRRREIAQSMFRHFVDKEPIPARLTWSSKLEVLYLDGMMCKPSELQSVLSHAAFSLTEVALKDLILMPERRMGPRSCLVRLLAWIRNNMSLSKFGVEGNLSNAGMQHWYPQGFADSPISLYHLVQNWVLAKQELCPLDYVAIPEGWYDLGKMTHQLNAPEHLKELRFTGDTDWIMKYPDHNYGPCAFDSNKELIVLNDDDDLDDGYEDKLQELQDLKDFHNTLQDDALKYAAYQRAWAPDQKSTDNIDHSTTT